MGKKHRSNTEILAEILQAANGRDINKIRMMTFVFLSFTQLKAYLAIAIQNGLLEYSEKTQTFKTSEKGLKLLGVLEQVHGQFQKTTKYYTSS